MSEFGQEELWECLFLTLPEVEEVLARVKEKATNPFIYPMFVMAAHTGARRSELIRSQIDGVDFDGGVVLPRDKNESKAS